MIEVFGKLDRGTVYLAGEAIDGTVTFQHKGRESSNDCLIKMVK